MGRKNRHGIPIIKFSKDTAPRNNRDKITQHNKMHWVDLREIIWAKTDGRCYYCGTRMGSRLDMTVDHYIPLSSFIDRDEADAITNLMPCCLKCNQDKGPLHPNEYRRQVGRPFYGDKLDAKTVSVK